MRVAQALSIGSGTLPRRAGLKDPRREARWLLAAAMAVRESWLYAHPDSEVPSADLGRYREWLIRRAAGEPAHHLTGTCQFWGRDFIVTPRVLIPRPETELLVEQSLALPVPAEARVLEVGAGSGCIAVTLAAERPRWVVTATDRSSGALLVARANAAFHGVALHVALGDLAAHCAGGWDLVVANLPYLPSGVLVELPLEVRQEPRMALDGGRDGLDLLRRLLTDLARLLLPGGRALLELGDNQADPVARMAWSCGVEVEARGLDVGGCERWVRLARPSTFPPS